MPFFYFVQRTFDRLSCQIFLCIGLLSPIHSLAQVPTDSISPIAHPRAHAHNDYEHTLPLWNALQHGFMSVEADVWLINGVLYVKHFKPKNLEETPTLNKLYLEPLSAIISKQKGRVYPNNPAPFYLMIDIKHEGIATYEALKKMCKPYLPLLEGENPPLKIFLSGARPIEQMLADKHVFMGIDGRPEDIGKGYSAADMPVISQRYGKITKWKGKTPISEEEFQVLKNLADACHKEGKKLRLWASPETELAWKTLLDAGIDLLNTDKLEEMDLFLQARIKKE